MVNICINGAAGKIGRSVTYEIMRDPKSLNVVLLNDPAGIDSVIHSLTKHDAVHGKYDWSVEQDGDDSIKINGSKIRVTNHKNPSEMPFVELGVDYVEECSGFWGNDKETGENKAKEFLNHGVKRVIQSYPANASRTIIMGANHDLYDPATDYDVSNGSCTTKAIVMPLQTMLNNGLGIEAVLMDTVHAATGSQVILDSLDNVGTAKTGAAIATAKVITELEGKMGGISYRVPTLDGSFANIYAVTSASSQVPSVDELNSMFVNAANDESYMGRFAVLDDNEVSTKEHIIGRTENSLVALSKTVVLPLPQGGALLTLVAGYDNERGPPADQVALTHYMASKEI